MVIKYFLHEIHKFKESKLRENILENAYVDTENNVAVRNFSCLIDCEFQVTYGI